jgi:hypothetical protein
LRFAAGHNDDDIGPINSWGKIGRRAVDSSEPATLAFDVYTAARSDFREL